MFKKLHIYLISILIFLGTLFILFTIFDKTRDTPHTHVNYEILEEGDEGLLPEYQSFFMHPPLSQVRATKYVKGQLVYDVVYETNKWGFRKLPHFQPEAAKEHLIFGGCSFGFGEGLNLEDTLPYKVEQELTRINTYNFSFQGGGAHTLLGYMDAVSPENIIKEEKGKFVYLFMNNHLSRWFGRPDYLSWANEEMLHFEVENGKVVKKGKLKEMSFYQNFKKISEMGLPNTALTAPQIIKDKYDFSDEELKDFVLGIEALKEKYLSHFPEGEFYFFFHPNSYRGSLEERLTKFALKKGIQVINPRSEFLEHIHQSGGDYKNFEIKQDFHPNGPSNTFTSNYVLNTVFKKAPQTLK